MCPNMMQPKVASKHLWWKEFLFHGSFPLELSSHLDTDFAKHTII